MSIGLLFDDDTRVAEFVHLKYGIFPMKFDRAVGLVREGYLVGGAIFGSFNGHNVNLTYCGESTITLGIVRALARFAVFVFNPSRVTVTTSKRNKHLMRSLQKFGFVLEGSQTRFYGMRDCVRNTGVRFVLFREGIEKLAGVSTLNEGPANVNGSSAKPQLQNTRH